MDDYDSCRYFSNDREMDLIRQYAATIKREPGVTQNNTPHPPAEKKKSGGYLSSLLPRSAIAPLNISKAGGEHGGRNRGSIYALGDLFRL